ncbi:MAG: ClbS/DfsB family four-helix bundle protein [Candidatus Heimdallarchaeota archaeon]
MKISKTDLIAAVRAARAYLLEIIEDFNPEEMLQPTKIGKWCVKDILSHIAGWDTLMRTTMRAIFEGKQPDLSATKDIDATNVKFVDERSGWSVEQILAEMAENHQKMLQFVEELTDEQLFKPRIFAGENWSLDGFLKIWDRHDRLHAKKIVLCQKAWKSKQI